MYVYVRACTLSPLLFERVFRQQTPSMTEWSPSCGECGFLQCLGISVKEGECSYDMVVQQIIQCFEIKSIARQQICIMVSDCFIHENKKQNAAFTSLCYSCRFLCVCLGTLWCWQTQIHIAPPIKCQLFLFICLRNTLNTLRGVHLWLWTVVSHLKY